MAADSRQLASLANKETADERGLSPVVCVVGGYAEFE